MNNEVNMPRMSHLRAAAKEVGIPYKRLLIWCKENKIANVRVGRDFYINMNKLAEYLNNPKEGE